MKYIRGLFLGLIILTSGYEIDRLCKLPARLEIIESQKLKIESLETRVTSYAGYTT